MADSENMIPTHRTQLLEAAHQHRGYELIFKGIGVTIDKKPVLQDINGVALPGEMLAIMGPSGAGKTTLLNCLAGRRDIDEGHLTLNSRSLTKSIRRKISYVLQNDTFFPELTCWQTIWYTAQLRLPGSMSSTERRRHVDEIIDALDMRKCLNTKIGGPMNRGLSGGEKKRTNIACELLTNPALMLLDEPTSGLDSSTSYSLIRTLKDFAKKSGKTVVMTIHQPSSQIFHMFDKLLLLCDGQVAYFGDVNHCSSFFSGIELGCPSNYNLADHILDKVKDTDEVKDKIMLRAKQQKSEKWYPPELKSGAIEYHQENEISDNQVALAEVKCEPEKSTDLNCRFITSTGFSSTEKNNLSSLSAFDTDSASEDSESLEAGEDSRRPQLYSKWPTTFIQQYTVLFKRNIRQSRPLILSKEQMMINIITSLFAGLLWFQTAANEESLKDRQGLMFFALTFTDFGCMIGALNSIPVEMPVVNKERLGGYYRLSAYYLAKITSQSTLVLLLPTLLFTVFYWLSGLNYSFHVYIQMLLTINMSNLTAQGLGFLFGYLITEFSLAFITGITTMLCMMLAGGFYVRNVPVWASWLKYVSFMSLTYYSLVDIDLSNVDIRCSQGESSFLSCTNTTGIVNGTEMYIPRDDLMDSLTLRGEGWQRWNYLVILGGIMLLPYILTYIILRIKKPVSS